MSKSKKNAKTTRKAGGGAAFMQQMGLKLPPFDESGMMGGMDDDDDDDELEAELRRFQRETGAPQNSRQKKSDKHGVPDIQGFHRDVNKLLSEIDQPINENDLSDVDEDELLAELNEITDEINEPAPIAARAKPTGNSLSLLQQRQAMYTSAIATAKANGDASKTRRLERQLKTIQELIQTAQTGGPINEEDIPPEIFVQNQPNATTTVPKPTVPQRAPSPPRPMPAPEPHVVQQSRITKPQPAPVSINVPVAVQKTRDQLPQDNTDPAIERLKELALQAKRSGDMNKAKEYLIQIRTMRGEASTASGTTSATVTHRTVNTQNRETYDNEPDDEPEVRLPLKAPEPRTIMEALEQRYQELTKRGEEAAVSGDRSKARRMERLSKTYEEAMTATRKGQSYDYNSLPDIPGFAPIPVQAGKPQVTAVAPSTSKPVHGASQGRPMQPAPERSSAVNTTATRKNQQAITLRAKQEKFQKLALEAKGRNDLETAKKFLIAYKGLEQMIQAAESGLPIDMSQVPKLPDDETDLINDDDLTEDLLRSDRDTVYRRLQEDLLRQIQLCARNQQIYNEMDGIENSQQAQEYRKLEQRCAQDLEKLRQSFQNGYKPPLFHYERRQMNVVQVNQDLGENDLEVTILRGINLPVPSGYSDSTMETYVVIEFPYPTEDPQTAKTRHATGAANAEYNENRHKFYIKRNDAKFRRLMGRKELKMGVFYKAGFLRADRPLGIASIKLMNLEQCCTIHESVDLFEAEHRKKIEGKLEVKLRIREALSHTKASEILPQRWLVIDRFEETSRSGKTSSSSSTPAITALARLVPTGEVFSQIALNMATGGTSSTSETDSHTPAIETTHHHKRRSQPQPVATNTPRSVQVLNYEASMLKEQIQVLGDSLTPDQRHHLRSKIRSIEEDRDTLVEMLRSGGKPAIQEHVRGLHELEKRYDEEAREYHQRRDTKKAEIALQKKKMVLKEINTLVGEPPVVKDSTRL